MDCRLIAELTLHGVFGKEGLQVRIERFLELHDVLIPLCNLLFQSIGALLQFINLTEKTDHPSHSIVTSLFTSLGWELAAFIPKETKDAKHSVNIDKGR